MALRLVTAPTEYPVTLEEAKAHLNVDHDDDDAVITAFIGAATGYAEQFLGRALIEQTWDLYLDTFPTAAIEVPLPPLIEVVGVFYLDGDGDEQEFAAASYSVDNSSMPGRVTLLSSGSWPTAEVTANAVRVRFRAGYPSTEIDDGDTEGGTILLGEDGSELLGEDGSTLVDEEGVVPGDDSPPIISVGNVPPEIKVAILLHVGSFYHNRENLVTGQTVALLPFGAEMLLRPYRVLLGMA